MLWHPTLLLTWLCSLFTLAVSSSELIVQTLPGKTSVETVQEVRRHLLNYASQSDSNIMFDITTICVDSSGVDSELLPVFKSAFPNDPCLKCYIKCYNIRVELLADIDSFKPVSIPNGVKNSPDSTFDEIEDDSKSIMSIALNNIKRLRFDRGVSDIESAPVDLSGSFPEFNLAVELDKMELFIELDTVLSGGSTYTFNIFTSKSPVGIKIDNDLLLGIMFTIGLILSVNTELDVGGGFHVELGEKVSMKVELFGNEPDDLELGGKVKFLPVRVKTRNAVLHAILRPQVRLGASIKSSDASLPFDIDNLDLDNLGANIEARVFANVVDFTTNLTSQAGPSQRIITTSHHNDNGDGSINYPASLQIITKTVVTETLAASAAIAAQGVATGHLHRSS